MNIGIIDADLIGRPKHRFPNLACMKLSAHYKKLGRNVTLITDYRDLFSKFIELSENIEPKLQFLILDDTTKKGYVRYYNEEDVIFDKIVISKVFTDTPIPIQIKNLGIVEYGGTGFYYDKAPKLPEEIEHHMPDYHLYDDWVKKELEKGGKKLDYKYYTDYSVGFTTRGCFRKCEFCVNKNYNKVEIHSPLNEFVDKDRKYICMLDDNILGFGQWKCILQSLQNTGKRFEYKQGMDLRIMTDEKAKILSQSKYIGDYIFAFDNIADKDQIEEKLKLWRKYCSKTTKLYVFCGFDRNDRWDDEFWIQDIRDIFKRVRILMKHSCLPYIMRFNKYEESPHRGMNINFARWCNQPNFFKKKSFREFCIANGSNSSCYNYMDSFENEYPKIAEKYYDLKYADYKNRI